MENSVESDPDYLAYGLALFSTKRRYFCSARVILIRLEADLDVCCYLGVIVCWCSTEAWCSSGRSCPYLYAYDP